MQQIVVGERMSYQRPLGAQIEGFLERAAHSIVRGFDRGIPLWGVTCLNAAAQIRYRIFCGSLQIFEGPGVLREMEYVDRAVMYRVDTVLEPSSGISYSYSTPHTAMALIHDLENTRSSVYSPLQTYQERFSQYFKGEAVVEREGWRETVEANRREQGQFFDHGKWIEPLSATACVKMRFPLRKWLLPHYAVEFRKDRVRLRAPDVYSEIVYLSIEEGGGVVCGALRDFNTYERIRYTLS